MSDRLYIVNTDTKEYCCIAKCFGTGYSLGNIDLLTDFIKDSFGFENNLILVPETNNELWEKHIKDGVNFNTENKWD